MAIRTSLIWYWSFGYTFNIHVADHVANGPSWHLASCAHILLFRINKLIFEWMHVSTIFNVIINCYLSIIDNANALCSVYACWANAKRKTHLLYLVILQSDICILYLVCAYQDVHRWKKKNWHFGQMTMMIYTHFLNANLPLPMQAIHFHLILPIILSSPSSYVPQRNIGKNSIWLDFHSLF